MNRWLAWNVIFPLQERLKGHPTFSILREMEAADRMSPAELEHLRAEKLRHFVDYCYAHVPYVRTIMQRAGATASDIRGPADLSRLPIMTKADVRQYRESIRSERAGKLVSLSTSGSTGAPLVLDLSRRRVASHVACRLRVGRWWGVSVGMPELVLWGPPLQRSYRDRLRSLRDRLLTTRFLSAYAMTDSIISGYLDLIATGGWRQMISYPSAAYLLCLYARKQGRDMRTSGIKVVFVTGEVLLPHQRRLISETLGCPVADGYGGRDSGFVAHECPYGGLHIMADAVIVEIVDTEGRPVPAGEAGEIVVTDLYSDEAPFLRYATGDVGVASSRRCTCGRPLPLLDRIEGRSIDTIVAPDGRVIPGLALNPVLWPVAGIESVRICQKAPDWFHVQIVPGRMFREQSESAIQNGFSKVLGSPIRVTFEYLANISVESSGKFRFLVSELPRGQAVRKPEGYLNRVELN